MFVNGLKGSSTYRKLMKFENVTASDDVSKCNMLADFFQSVYVADSDTYVPVIVKDNQPIFSIEAVIIDRDDIERELSSNLDPCKGAGPDNNVPNIFLKMTANKPLHTLFSRFLHAECFQSQWQSSVIVPIFKSGVKSDVRN